MAKLSLSIGHLSFVQDITSTARSKWYHIGLKLRLPVGTLDVIAQKNGDATDHHLDMLKHWLKGTGAEPTGEALVAALKSPSVGEPKLALEVEARLLELQSQGPLSEGAFMILSNKSKWVRLLPAMVSLLMIVISLYPHNYLHSSKNLPYPIQNFVGREADMETILQQLDFTVPGSQIVSIVGPPGFGKSTLAIHIGHRMAAEQVYVYYFDMREVPSMQSLAEKVIIIIDNGTDIITVNELYEWARELKQRTLLILDDCDDMLQNETKYSELHNVTVKLLEQSLNLKVLITSRSRIAQSNKFTHRVHELSTEASCELLHDITSYHGTLTSSLNSHTCESIANMVANVPLALQVVGALLNQPDSPEPVRIISKLQENSMSSLSPENLPIIRLSYFHLTSQLQEIGRHLASFPGSFDEEAACEILFTVVSTCNDINGFLSNLVGRSLLEYNQRTNRYQFHRLIRKFFLHTQQSTGNIAKVERQTFRMAFIQHYSPRLLAHSITFSKYPLQTSLSFRIEKHNFLQLFRLLETPHNFSHSEISYTIITLALALDSVLLEISFTAEELYTALQHIITFIAQNWGYEIPSDYNNMISYLQKYSTLKLPCFKARLGIPSSRYSLLRELYLHSIKEDERLLLLNGYENIATLFQCMRNHCVHKQSFTMTYINCLKMTSILGLDTCLSEEGIFSQESMSKYDNNCGK